MESGPQQAMGAERNRRVLIVDDQDTILEILREYLRAMGMRRVDAASSSSQALAMLKHAAGDYDLVIADWNMEPLSGLELLNVVRADPELAETPFIMITGENTKDRVVAAIKSGVTSYMVKPVSLETLRKRVNAVFGQA